MTPTGSIARRTLAAGAKSGPKSKTHIGSAQINTAAQKRKINGSKISKIFRTSLKSRFFTMYGYRLSEMGDKALLPVVISRSAEE